MRKTIKVARPSEEHIQQAIARAKEVKRNQWEVLIANNEILSRIDIVNGRGIGTLSVNHDMYFTKVKLKSMSKATPVFKEKEEGVEV